MLQELQRCDRSQGDGGAASPRRQEQARANQIRSGSGNRRGSGEGGSDDNRIQRAEVQSANPGTARPRKMEWNASASDWRRRTVHQPPKVVRTVQLSTVVFQAMPHALVMANDYRFDGAVAELRKQGLVVTVHNPANETFYIKAEGIFAGYVVTGTELLELKSANNLNIRGIQSLG